MRTTTRLKHGVALAAAVAAGGCGIVGPSCLGQRKTGPVTTVEPFGHAGGYSDSAQATHYTISITWFSGPGC